MTQIHNATPEQSATLSKLAKLSKTHWGYSQELIDLWDAEDAFTITPEMCASGLVRVLQKDDQPIGFYRIEGDPPHAELSDLWISPNEIGHGYGGQLMTDLKQFAFKKGYEVLEIHSDPNALGFYEHAGAKRIGDTRPHPKTGRTLPILQLTIREQ